MNDVTTSLPFLFVSHRQVPELVSPSASDESSDNLPDITNHGDDDDDSPPLLVESSDYDDDDEDDCPPLESDDSEFDDVSDEDSEVNTYFIPKHPQRFSNLLLFQRESNSN